MDKRVKGLWTAALRSGEYEQATGMLRKVNLDGTVGYCCLGVLCEVAIKDGLEVDFNEEFGEYDLVGSFLPSSVRNWAGMGNSGSSGDLPVSVVYPSPDYDDGFDTATSLVALNDGAGFSFDEIADVIEEQF